MKFEKQIVLYDVEKEGLEKIIEEKEKCRPILSLGDSIPWKRNTKQIFLSYAEKMANLLPPENRNRLEVEALSLFPANDEVCGEESLFSPYHFALPFDDKYIVEESESKQDKEEWEKCKESDMPYLDTYYGRIYTNMLKPRAIPQGNKTKNIGEELIDVAEKLIFSLRLHIRSMAWDIAKNPEGMKDALRLMDWFNEFSSSFMAEIGKIACVETHEKQQLVIEAVTKELYKEKKDKEKVVASYAELKAEKEAEEEIKKREEAKLNELSPWIQSLCGLKGYDKVLDYRLDQKKDKLFFSLNENCKDFGKLGKRIFEDLGYLEEGLDIESRGLEKRLRELTDNFENGPANNTTQTLAKKIRACKKVLKLR